MFNQGAIQRFRLRDKLFTPLLPDRILKYHLYKQRAGGVNWFLMVLTKRDICYWDSAESRYAFLTQQYAVGTASFVQGDATVTAGGGANFTNLKAGDFITIGATYSSDDTWYEVLSVAADTLELTTNYAGANTGAVAYKARKTYAGTNTDYWSCVTYENKFYATNNGIDYVQEWPGSNLCVDITNLVDKCRYLYEYEGHLLAINLVTGTYPQRIKGSDLANATNWTTGDATTFDVKSVHPLKGAAIVKGFLILFTEESIHKYWYVGGTLIYNGEKIVDGIGCKAPHSIIERDTGCFFYANDNKFRFFTGFSWDSISDNIFPKTSAFSPTYEEYIQGIFVKEYNQLLWACPSSESEGYLDRLWTFDLDGAQWSESDVDISCLGSYLSEDTYTWATLPYATWDDWNWSSWDSRFNIAGAPYILAGGYDGYTYRLNFTDTDAGASYNSYFCLETDLMQKGGLHYRKRITELQIFVKKRSEGTLTVKCSREGSGFTDAGAGSISLNGTPDILKVRLPCDDSGSWFRHEFSSTGFYEFLGVIFQFSVIGER